MKWSFRSRIKDKMGILQSPVYYETNKINYREYWLNFPSFSVCLSIYNYCSLEQNIKSKLYTNNFYNLIYDFVCDATRKVEFVQENSIKNSKQVFSL